MNDLEMLCFDVLGDFVDPATVKVDAASNAVEVRGCPAYLRGVIRSEWEGRFPGRAPTLIFSD